MLKQNSVKYTLCVCYTHALFLPKHMHCPKKKPITNKYNETPLFQSSNVPLYFGKTEGWGREVEWSQVGGMNRLWCHGRRVAHGHQSPADSRHFWHSYETSFHCAAGDLPFIQLRKREGKELGTGREGRAEKEEGGVWWDVLTFCSRTRCWEELNRAVSEELRMLLYLWNSRPAVIYN